MARRNKYAEDAKKGKLSKENLKEAIGLFKFILPYKVSFIIALLLLVLSSSIFLIFPDAAGEMSNIANGKGKWGLTLNQLGALLAVLLLSQSILSFIRILLFTRVSERGMADLRNQLFQKLITMPVPFFDERRVGELTSRITNDISILQSTFSITIAQFIRQFILFIGGIGFIFYKTPRLSLIMLATIPVVVLGAMVFGRFIRKIAKERQDKLASSNVIVDESLQSVHVVKAFTSEWLELKRYKQAIESVVNVSMRLAVWRGLFLVFVIFIMFGAIFFIIWMGAQMVQSGKMEVGDLTSFLLYTVFIAGAIASFGGVYEQLLTALGATERVREILKETTEPIDLSIAENQVKQLKGDIEFKQIQFSYPSRLDIEVLKGIDMKIAAGKKVALVGASGAGKSTIIQMLLHFYQPDQGEIFVDGQNISDYSLSEYRQNIGFVPQEVMLFGGTIRENIAYGKQGTSDKEVQAAAEKANAWEFISTFPEGLDTIVGDRGIKLSGGQRQRIAIARAILRDPAILLLDEATSSLDAESEKVVQDALNVLMEGRTSIIIAHRLATIKDVDCIYVLEHGKIIEQGSHAELSVKKDGAYSNLAKLQFELS